MWQEVAVPWQTSVPMQSCAGKTVTILQRERVRAEIITLITMKLCQRLLVVVQ